MNSKNGLHITVMSVVLLGVVGLLSGCGGGGGSSSSGGGATLTQIGGAMQGNPLVLASSVSTLAGTAGVVGSKDGTVGTEFNYPSSVTTDGANLYVADTSSHTIRKIVIATGAVTAFAGSAGVPDSTDGIGSLARFYSPYGITTDGVNLYVADTFNHIIRKLVIATGAVTTVAGSAGAKGTADGTTTARFNFPFGITTDGANLYVADTSNDTIRKIVIATGAVTTLAGSAGLTGSADGTAAARFNQPTGITTDGANLYVADSNNDTIRKIVIATGAVTTLAGSAGVASSTDGTGAVARFRSSYGITTDGTNLYVADTFNHTIRKIVIATGAVTTLAGSAGVSGITDGTAARFYYPKGITTDGASLYVADTVNHTIRRIQ